MEIKKEINGFYELADMVWSGAVDTIADIQNADKEDEFMNFLEMVFSNNIPTNTKINDFIWFERDFIYENIGLTENGELPEEIERIDIDDVEYSAYNSFQEFCADMDDCDVCPFGDLVNACENLFADYKKLSHYN